MSGGAWTAEGGPLRPGLLALWQHLVNYGVHAIIADDLCAAPSLHPVSALHLDHALTHPGRSPRRTYPSQVDAGLLFTLGLQLVLVNGFEVVVDTAALADMEHAEEAARAWAHDCGCHALGWRQGDDCQPRAADGQWRQGWQQGDDCQPRAADGQWWAQTWANF